MRKFIKAALMCLIVIVSVSSVTTGQVTKLIVVDPLVADEISNISKSFPGGNLLLLPENGNPLLIIAGELKKQAYAEIHIFALSKPGSIIFDEVAIIDENINDFTEDFSEWRSPAGTVTVIIIHSGVLTLVPEGNYLVNMISGFTGMKVIVE